MSPLILLDYAGVAVFAATGALAASRKQLDLIGFLFLAAATGIGGGTVRDLTIDAPVFWIVDPGYLTICAGVAILVYFSAHRLESRYKLLLWLDAVGLAAYSALGAQKGMVATGSIPVGIVMGVMTATFGGILRDLLAGEPSVLLKPEIYVTAALTGSATYAGLYMAGVPVPAAALLAFAAAFAVRGCALRFGWSIPTYRSRPGRRPEDIP